MLQKVKTLETLIFYRQPLIEAIKEMDYLKTNSIYKTNFEIFVRKQLNNAKIIGSSTQVLEQIKKAYSIKNLLSHRLITIDDSTDKISFVRYLEDMFRDISEEIKPKPITKRTFIEHINSLDNLIKDSLDYLSYTQNEKESFIEDLKKTLNNIKQDFEKNKDIIEHEVNNLSRFLENDNNDVNSKREIMKNIIILSDKYIEPFFNFLQETQSEKSLMNKLNKIKAFFHKLDYLDEEIEITKFIINFNSYINVISDCYSRLNDYRRKRNEDLTVYNAFENAFQSLRTLSEDILDGKLINNTLETSSFHNSFSLFDNIKNNQFIWSEISIDYQDLIERFDRLTESLKCEKSSSVNDIVPINTERLQHLERISLETNQITILNNQNMNLISNILKINKSSLLEKDEKHDLIYKLHKILSLNMTNYDAFFTIYAYNSIRKEIKNVKVGYNERKEISCNNIIYEYRPVYNLGELNND